MEVQREALRFNAMVFSDIFQKKRLLEACIRGIQHQLELGESSNLVVFEKQLQYDY